MQLIQRKIESRRDTTCNINSSSCSDSDSNLNESIDLLRCGICLSSKNEIMLKCSVNNIIHI